MPVHARTAVRDRALRIPPFRLNTYIEGIRQGWPEHDIERVIVRGLPRHFHAQSRQTQTARLGERVPLTHTRWDALLAAMVEHLAQLHDHPVPAWVNETRALPRPPVDRGHEPVDSTQLPDVLTAGVPAARGDPGPARPRWARGRTRCMGSLTATPCSSCSTSSTRNCGSPEPAHRSTWWAEPPSAWRSLENAARWTWRQGNARIDKGHYELTKAVQEIGRRHGLGDTWLNDQATHGDSPPGRHRSQPPCTRRRT